MKLQTMFLVKQIESGPIETLIVLRRAISFTDMLAVPVKLAETNDIVGSAGPCRDF